MRGGYLIYGYCDGTGRGLSGLRFRYYLFLGVFLERRRRRVVVGSGPRVTESKVVVSFVIMGIFTLVGEM